MEEMATREGTVLSTQTRDHPIGDMDLFKGEAAAGTAKHPPTMVNITDVFLNAGWLPLVAT